MQLFLGQLVYTSFPGTGFVLIASARVLSEIQQAFIERVASQYRNSSNQPSGYRAVFLHQVTPEHCLFGWLYNGGLEDMSCSHLPYFICYYLEGTLYAFHLEIIFTFLHRGPVALIDRHSLSASLETRVVLDLSGYQPARPGVAIPLPVRQGSHIARKQGELLDLFVPVNEQEMVIGLDNQIYEQQIAHLSIYNCYIIEGIGIGEKVLNEDAATIETSILKLDQGYKEKLQQYEQALIEAIKRQYPIKDRTYHSLKRLQQVLRLKDENIAAVEPGTARPIKAVQTQKLTAPMIRSRDVTLVKALNEAVAVNASDTRSYRGVLPKILSIWKNSKILSQKNNPHNFVPLYRNSQLLLRLGIAVTVLAMIISISGILQTSIFVPNDPNATSSASHPVFYKTLAEVPNVPQGVFNYGGSTAFAPLRSKTVVSALNQAHPQFQLRYVEQVGRQPGSSTGLQMLLAGELSFVQSSRPLKDTEFAQAKEHGFTLEQIPVAIDGVAFYVNPQVSISGLNLSQVRDIFAGKITNWKAVGGPDLQITTFNRNLNLQARVSARKNDS